MKNYHNSMETVALPELEEGEVYAGLILEENGTPGYHLILLPGELDAASHSGAMAWAKERGRNLPNYRELSLLYANARQHFKSGWCWYWSRERGSDCSYAGSQCFANGTQSSNYVNLNFRARAVRRLPLRACGDQGAHGGIEVDMKIQSKQTERKP